MFDMCFWYWFSFLMLLFQTFNHCNFVSLQICFLTKFMMIAFILLIINNSWAVLLISWFAFSFSIMLLQLDIHCMLIWHWFWRKLIKFCCMSSNNFALTLLFVFSLCKVIWLSVYTQISLFLSAFSLHITIASLIACSFAFVMMILPETLVALLHLMSSCVNITVVLISVSTSAFFFRICNASVYITMFFAFLIILSNSLYFFIFLYFFIKCMQSMTMTLSRRCAYVKLHVPWSKSLLYIFSLINHIDSLCK